MVDHCGGAGTIAQGAIDTYAGNNALNTASSFDEQMRTDLYGILGKHFSRCARRSIITIVARVIRH